MPPILPREKNRQEGLLIKYGNATTRGQWELITGRRDIWICRIKAIGFRSSCDLYWRRKGREFSGAFPCCNRNSLLTTSSKNIPVRRITNALETQLVCNSFVIRSEI
ncbi:hypothetical protein CEXT_444011 [Caerostris extrusa]|uniref:Uncharacterized protein n=1 Tax=Caerostris extrusa TaxID=172846 RepID=A0AAV4SPY8_CAEEX|nr:hypothetical protein CEXT_444011 [Caerostris extrusa]